MNEISIKKADANNRLFIACVIFSLIILITSYLAQYAWKIEPCNLCKYQRLPWLATLLFSGCAFFPSFKKMAIFLIQVAFLFSVILAAWHLLILSEIVTDPCSVPKNIHSFEDFEKMLSSSPPCSTTGWKILGIPASGYNLILSLIFSFIFLRQKIMPTPKIRGGYLPKT